MAITFRHDAASVVPPPNTSTRKYGQELVMQQKQQNQQMLMQAQQQKYQGYQAGLDRLFDATKQINQNQFQLQRDQDQKDFVLSRDKAAAERAQQQEDAKRQRAFMDDARKQSGRFIMDSIEKGEYDDVTAKELRQNLIEESEALGNPGLDATQRAEALNKLRARRSVLSANRMPKEPAPTAQQQFDQGLVTGPDGAQYRQNAKGVFEPLPSQPKRPTSAQEAFQADTKTRDKYMEDAKAIVTEGGKKPLTPESRREAATLAQKLYEEDNNLGTPTAAPEMAGAAPASPGTASSILEAPLSPVVPIPNQAGPTPSPVPMAQQPVAGMPPAPSQSPPPAQPAQGSWIGKMQEKLGMKPAATAPAPATQMAQLPDQGVPPAPQPQPLPLTPNSSSQNPVGAQQQQVKVGGKSLVVSPGTLTPQETQARQQIMTLPREQRIAALMPYDPQLKGQTLEQLLASPETKAQYDELTKQGLTTGNYQEDMLAHLDEMLQHNVLRNAGRTKPDAFVGMRADEVTDPKAKAEVDKMPRPQSPDDMRAIRGPYFVDPSGVIRSTQKQA